MLPHVFGGKSPLGLRANRTDVLQKLQTQDVSFCRHATNGDKVGLVLGPTLLKLARPRQHAPEKPAAGGPFRVRYGERRHGILCRPQ